MNKHQLTQKIKIFEHLYNGIDEAFIDVNIIKKTADKIFCEIILYADDFGSKTVYKDVEYPVNILQKI